MYPYLENRVPIQPWYFRDLELNLVSEEKQQKRVRLYEKDWPFGS